MMVDRNIDFLVNEKRVAKECPIMSTRIGRILTFARFPRFIFFNKNSSNVFADARPILNGFIAPRMNPTLYLCRGITDFRSGNIF